MNAKVYGIKCKICGHDILYCETYGDWYFCTNCGRDYSIEGKEDGQTDKKSKT